MALTFESVYTPITLTQKHPARTLQIKQDAGGVYKSNYNYGFLHE